MKKKIWIPIIVIVVLLAILFVPIRQSSYDDGGTKEYIALTYKIVHWNRLTDDGVYEKTRIYFGADRNKSIDELFKHEYQKNEYKFIATVLEINGDSVLVEPVSGEEELSSSDKISFSVKGFSDIGAKVGSIVEITYKGSIMESYPAKINATEWKISKNLRHLEYTETWINKETAKKLGNDVFTDIIITEIYSNCFFAYAVTYPPVKIKLNGTLSDEWCVGDQVIAKYSNNYYDSEKDRMEVDFTSVEASDWEPEPGIYYKPVIYLYPEEETEIDVKLDFKGNLSCTYPSYQNGWKVTASPDGTLTDENGQTYNYLYWEGESYIEYDLSKGFCIKGEDTETFLEDALAKLGLNRREANEFIVYWLPMMQNNPYNIISFQTDIYTESAKLQIEPNTDTIIRVFMAWKSSDTFIEIEKQELSAPERNGFTVVEWGGSKVK